MPILIVIFLRFVTYNILCRSSLAHEGSGYSIFRAELPVGIVGVYGIGGHASYPHVHESLLHTDAVLQTYTLVESPEREVFDERYAVYLYIVHFCAELDGFGFLAPYDGTYIMTVNAYNTVTDLPALEHFLLLYQRLPDDGKTLPVILCIPECGSVLSMDSIPLYEELFKKPDHAALEHSCP